MSPKFAIEESSTTKAVRDTEIRWVWTGSRSGEPLQPAAALAAKSSDKMDYPEKKTGAKPMTAPDDELIDDQDFERPWISDTPERLALKYSMGLLTDEENELRMQRLLAISNNDQNRVNEIEAELLALQS